MSCDIPAEAAEAALRAMKSVATSDGELEPVERELLDAVQRHLLETSFDLDSLLPIRPEEVAEAVASKEVRRHVLNGCVLMALVDQKIDLADERQLRRLAKALQVTDPSLAAVHHYLRGHRRRLWWNVIQRFVAGVRFRYELREHGVRSIWPIVRDIRRDGDDEKLVARYRAFQELPAGTLGRAYFDFVKANDFNLPGEKGSPPELVTFHDATHVLAGYRTDPLEEIRIGCFHAGTHKADPFGMMLFLVFQMHLHVVISPANHGLTGWFHPEPAFEAFARGRKVPGDLMRDWDPQPNWERKVDDLRRELGIPPRTDVATESRPIVTASNESGSA